MITMNTVISIYKSAISEPKYEHVRDYCIEFIAKSNLSEISETEDFKNLDSQLQV